MWGVTGKKRTNYSHHKGLFTIYNLDAPPDYAMVMAYKCLGECKRVVHGNDGDLLCTLPEYVANMYPVEPKYARGDAHVARNATRVFDELMVTCARGYCMGQSTNAI